MPGLRGVVSDKHEQNESAAEEDDSFEAFLKKAAHVDGSRVEGRRGGVQEQPISFRLFRLTVPH